MHFIATTQAQIEALKKRARRQQRNGGGKYLDLLESVARGAGYDHWHHVTECLKETEAARQDRSIVASIEHIRSLERRGIAGLVVTGPETHPGQPFILMATGTGDAWLLDPMEQRALCLMWRGEPQSIEVRDSPERLEILWDGHFELRAEFFVAATEHADIGDRVITGYPVDVLRQTLDRTQPAERKVAMIIDQEDSVPLDDALIARLLRQGWDSQQLARARRHGARYSPTRDTVMYPPMTEEDG